jgi:general L-amino acid transport system permease protein
MGRQRAGRAGRAPHKKLGNLAMVGNVSPASSPHKPLFGMSFWYDQRTRGILAQTLVMGLLGLLLYFVVTNTIQNLASRNIATGFWFLSQPAGFEIQMTLIPYSAESSHGRVFVVGLLNTLFISLLGCVFATILGFSLGVMRLSGNWLLGKIIYWYV